MGMLGTIVDVIQHDVLNGDATTVSVGFRNIAANRVQEGLNIIFLVDRHDLITNRIVGGVQEIASATSIISPSLSSAGTTPEVESVTRRFDRPKPKSSSMISIAGTTLVRFSSGSPIPIITTLVIGRWPVILAAPTIFAARHTADNF